MTGTKRTRFIWPCPVDYKGGRNQLFKTLAKFIPAFKCTSIYAVFHKNLFRLKNVKMPESNFDVFAILSTPRNTPFFTYPVIADVDSFANGKKYHIKTQSTKKLIKLRFLKKIKTNTVSHLSIVTDN